MSKIHVNHVLRVLNEGTEDVGGPLTLAEWGLNEADILAIPSHFRPVPDYAYDVTEVPSWVSGVGVFYSDDKKSCSVAINNGFCLTHTYFWE